MSKRIRFLCVALIVPILVSSSHVATAQWSGGYTPQCAATEAPQVTACLAQAATTTTCSPEDNVLIGEDPAQRFLLAYHYAYLGYPQPAVAQLDMVVELEPRDEIAVQLRNVMTPRLPAPGAPVITPGAVTRARNR